MFEGFANVWTPVELASRVKRRPVPLTIAGERIVLFRDSEGKIAALIDRCPHRGVALSLGKRRKEGTLECPFHGWQFDREGRCVHVPLNPSARCELLSATALPARELGGLVWIYTSTAAPPAEPFVPDSLTAPRLRRFYLVTHWKAHFTRAMENMLDMPHVPFVHRWTIGFAQRRLLKKDSEMKVSFTPSEHGGLITSSIDGAPQQGALHFLRPNGMMLDIPVPKKLYRIQVYCVPVGPSETRMIVITVRSFGLYNPLARIFDELNRLIILEDQAIVESASPAEVPPPGEERSVASDRPTLQFRKYYFEVLRESSAAPAPIPQSHLVRHAHTGALAK